MDREINQFIGLHIYPAITCLSKNLREYGRLNKYCEVNELKILLIEFFSAHFYKCAHHDAAYLIVKCDPNLKKINKKFAVTSFSKLKATKFLFFLDSKLVIVHSNFRLTGNEHILKHTAGVSER